MEYIARKSNLVVPEGFVELDREEMTYVDGGGMISVNISFSVGSIWSGLSTGFITGFLVSFFATFLGLKLPTWVGKLIGAGVGAGVGATVANNINNGAKSITIPIINIWLPFVSFKHSDSFT